MIRRTNLEIQSCAQVEDKRKVLLSFLSECFYEPLTLERLTEWSAALTTDWAKILVTDYPRLQNIINLIETKELAEVQENLQVEYHEIFNVFNEKGKILVPLWESFYIDKLTTDLNSPTYQMRHKLHEFNLRYKMDSFLPEDHLSVQLDFLIYLLDYVQEAEDARNYLNFEKGVYTEFWLLKDHLLKWVPAFNANIQNAKEDSVYIILAELLIEVLEEDYQYVRNIKQSIESE